VVKIGLDRGHNDPCFHRDEIYAHERDANPGIDDNALVQNPVKDVQEAGSLDGRSICIGIEILNSNSCRDRAQADVGGSQASTAPTIPALGTSKVSIQ
jgi:hypothetical protein